MQRGQIFSKHYERLLTIISGIDGESLENVLGTLRESSGNP